MSGRAVAGGISVIMKITEFAESHRKGFKKVKADIQERWNTRVVPQGLHTQGRTGAAEYLSRYGKGISAKKVVELALTAEALGASEMAAGFWEKAFELETGETARFDTGSGDTTPSIAVSTVRAAARPAVVLAGIPDSLQPGRIATMQATDTVLPRTSYILNPECIGQAKRDGHHDVTIATEEAVAHQSRSTNCMSPFSIEFDNAAKSVASKLGAFVLDGERYYKSASGSEHRSAAQAATENVNLGQGSVKPVVCYAIFKALYADGKDLRDTEDDLVRVKAAKPIGAALIAALKDSAVEVELLPTAVTTAEKQALADQQESEGREGEVWIRRFARYSEGKAHRTDIVRTKYVIELTVRVTKLTPTTVAGRLFAAIEVADIKTGKAIGSVGTGFDADDSKRLAALFAEKPDATFIEIAAQKFSENGILLHARYRDLAK